MTLSILLLVCAGLCSVIVGVAVGHVERRGYSLVRYQLLNCAVCVAVAVAGWAAAPSAMFPSSGCPPATWALVVAGTLLCGVFQYLMILMMGRAMKRGPNAIVWAIIQSGLIYPFSIYSGLLLAALTHIAVQRVQGTRLAPARRGEIRDLALWAGATGILTFLLCRYLKFPGLDRLESLGAGSMGYPVFVAACIAGYFPYGALVLRERLDARQAAGFVLGISGILLGCL